jgi:hypothetical protein
MESFAEQVFEEVWKLFLDGGLERLNPGGNLREMAEELGIDQVTTESTKDGKYEFPVISTVDQRILGGQLGARFQDEEDVGRAVIACDGRLSDLALQALLRHEIEGHTRYPSMEQEILVVRMMMDEYPEDDNARAAFFREGLEIKAGLRG